ncbi:DUF2207 domain-containing protein [Paucilactobacillus sp. N302-9]
MFQKILSGFINAIIVAIGVAVAAVIVLVYMTIAGLFNPLDLINKTADYGINRYQMNVQVQKNGDALVTEKANYDFHGYLYHGIYRIFDLNGLAGMSQLKVELKPNHKHVRQIPKAPKYYEMPIYSGLKTTYKKVLTPDAEKENKYTIQNRKNLKELKLYRLIIGKEKYQVIYHYRLKGFVTNYKDIAVINYKLIPRNWAVPLKHVSLRIKLPAKNINQLRAWTHGSGRIKTKVDAKTGNIVMTTRQNPKKQFMETHILMPKKIVSANKKIVNHNQKNAVLKQERSITMQHDGPLIALIGLLFVGTLGFQFWMNSWNRSHAGHLSKMVEIPHWFELPKMTPEVAKAVITQKPSKEVSASLIDRIAMGMVKITKDPESENSYGLKQIKPFLTADNSPDLLTSNEDWLFSLILNQVQPSNEDIGVTKKDIDRYTYDNYQDVVDAKNGWQGGVKRLADKYLDQDNILLLKNNQRTVWGIGIVGVVASAVAIRLNQWSLISICWLLTLLVVGYSYICYKKTTVNIAPYKEEYLQEISELKGFISMLKDFKTFKDSWPEDVILWERYLAFATAFGYAENVTEAFQINFPDEQLVDSPLFLSSYDGSFDFGEDWGAIDSVGDSSSSFGGFGSFGGDGGGGSFDGGSGGGGGDGGGGAF